MSFINNNNLFISNTDMSIKAGVPQTFIFMQPDGEEMLRFENNGDIFVKDKLVENDKEIVDAFHVFLRQQGLLR